VRQVPAGALDAVFVSCMYTYIQGLCAAWQCYLDATSALRTNGAVAMTAMSHTVLKPLVDVTAGRQFSRNPNSMTSATTLLDVLACGLCPGSHAKASVWVQTCWWHAIRTECERS
jgi:phage terminase small subunit